MWHVHILGKIVIVLSVHRSDHQEIGGDLEGAHVPFGWGGLMLMYSRSWLTSVSTRPGGRPTIVFSGDVTSTRQHSVRGTPMKKKKKKNGWSQCSVFPSVLWHGWNLEGHQAHENLCHWSWKVLFEKKWRKKTMRKWLTKVHPQKAIKTEIWCLFTVVCNLVSCIVTELLCAADNNGRRHLWHGGHKASDRLRVDTAVLHHHRRRRLGGLLGNGRVGLWHRPAARPVRTRRPARHRAVRSIPQLWEGECLFVFYSRCFWPCFAASPILLIIICRMLTFFMFS